MNDCACFDYFYVSELQMGMEIARFGHCQIGTESQTMPITKKYFSQNSTQGYTLSARDEINKVRSLTRMSSH